MLKVSKRTFQGYTIETKLITLEIGIQKLDSLYIHEEIIPEKKAELVNKMPSDGVFLHPIIVDRKSFVVLDGMHRVAAAKEIKIKYIPICLVDYENPNIHIGCWYRMFERLSEASEVEFAFRRERMSTTLQPYEVAHGLVEERRATTAAFSPNWALVGTTHTEGIKERYDTIKRIELHLQTGGYRMGYSTDRDALARIAASEFSLGLMTPTVTKREVIETALAGKVFSQKTTRHIIPARPMNVNVPMSWLRGDISLKKVNALLRDHLASKRINKLPPGQILDRRYDEELYIFNEIE
jgi:L-serine kinase (ADP)